MIAPHPEQIASERASPLRGSVATPGYFNEPRVADGTRSQLSPPAFVARIVCVSLFREHNPPLPCACHTPTPVGRHAGIERRLCLHI